MAQDVPVSTDDRYLAVLTDIAESLRVIAHRETQDSPQKRAIRMLVEQGTDNIAAIARAVGVNKGTLYRCAEFRAVLERIRGAAAWSARNPRAASRDEL